MKLVVHPFPSHRIVDAWREAASSGWLLHSPTEMRCGVGGALRQCEITNLDDAVLQSDIFAGIDCDDPSLLTAFAAVPFSRSQGFVMTIPRIVIVQRLNEDAFAIAEEGVDIASEIRSSSTPSIAPRAHRLAYEPSPDSYATAVAEAVEHLRRGDLAKVVLARSCRGEFTHDVNGGAIANRLHDLEPSCTIYSMPTTSGKRFVGASPELLVSVSDDEISCHPLAGTIANEGISDTSTYATWLLGSTKNRTEHRIVVDDIVDRLDGVATDITADVEPSIVNLRSVTHLGSHIRARRNENTSSLTALSALHPTPAVGGLPRREAVELIEKLEPLDRGFYAGAVGWCNAADEGSWWVAIRGIAFHDRAFEVWAGAGIVADSDPIAEREETRNKMDSVLHAIGVGTLN